MRSLAKFPPTPNLTLAVTLTGEPDLVRSNLCSTPPPSDSTRLDMAERGVEELGDEEVGVVG